MTRRLFIFASFDKDCIIDESVIEYVCALSKLGDVVFYMDSDADNAQLAKIKPFTIHTAAGRHGEYDFGSYKRGFIWAHNNNILTNYDMLYLVNDSMYGPLMPIGAILTNLESQNTDAVGMVFNPHKTEPHLQSWFLGMRPKIFLSNAFSEFITGVQKLSGKGLIAWAYEHGFTRMLIANNFSFAAAFNIGGRGIYNNIKKLYKRGFPFIKKISFTRKSGALGGQILYVLNHLDSDIKNAIINNASRVYGSDFVKNMLTRNPIILAYRHIKHIFYKLLVEGI